MATEKKLKLPYMTELIVHSDGLAYPAESAEGCWRFDHSNADSEVSGLRDLNLWLGTSAWS